MCQATLLGNNPGSFLPGRMVAHMLRVSTVEHCHPIILFVSVKTDDMAGFQDPFEARLS